MMHNDAAFEALADGQRRGLLIELLESGQYHVPELSSSSQEIAEANQRFLREYLSTDQESNAGDKELIRMHVVHIQSSLATASSSGTDTITSPRKVLGSTSWCPFSNW